MSNSLQQRRRPRRTNAGGAVVAPDTRRSDNNVTFYSWVRNFGRCLIAAAALSQVPPRAHTDARATGAQLRKQHMKLIIADLDRALQILERVINLRCLFNEDKHQSIDNSTLC
jgi:hypothetical protein